MSKVPMADRRPDDASEPACNRCGGTGRHTWTDGDCVLPHSYTGRNHPPKATTGHVCKYCITRHRDWLTEILDLYAHLVMILLPGSVTDTTAEHKHTKGDSAPAPVRLGALAMTADRDRLFRTGDDSDLPDVPLVLTEFAQRYCDDNGLAGASLKGTAYTAVHLLREHAEAIARQPWIDEYDAELSWMRRQLRSEHGMSSSGNKPVGRCPSLNGDGNNCGGPLWPESEGAMAVECGKCKRRFDEKFLRHLGGMMKSA